MARHQKSTPSISLVDTAMMLEKLRAIFASRMPVGYQDEKGFHYGNRPLPTFLKQSSARPVNSPLH